MPLELMLTVKQAAEWMEGLSVVDAPKYEELDPQSSLDTPQTCQVRPSTDGGMVELMQKPVELGQRLVLEQVEEKQGQWPMEDSSSSQDSEFDLWTTQYYRSQGGSHCLIMHIARSIMMLSSRILPTHRMLAHRSIKPSPCAKQDIKTQKDGHQLWVLGLMMQLPGCRAPGDSRPPYGLLVLSAFEIGWHGGVRTLDYPKVDTFEVPHA